MTKRYSVMGPLDALYAAARKYPGSVEALAQRMGKSPGVLRSKLSPDVDTHHITFEEALDVIELLDAAVPHAADMALRAIGYRLLRVFTRIDAQDSDDSGIVAHALAASGLTGLLACEVAGIAFGLQGEPSALTPAQADAIIGHVTRAMQALCLVQDTAERLRGDCDE